MLLHFAYTVSKFHITRMDGQTSILEIWMTGSIVAWWNDAID